MSFISSFLPSTESSTTNRVYATATWNLGYGAVVAQQRRTENESPGYTAKQWFRAMSIRCRIIYSYAGSRYLLWRIWQTTPSADLQTTVQVHNQVGLLQSLFSAAESSLTSQSGFSIDFKRPKFSRCVLNAACSETDSRINPAEDHCRAGYPCRRHPPGGAVGEIHETTSYGRNKNYWTPGGANK